MLQVRTYGLAGRSRLQKTALAIALVAGGALLLTVGLVLLLGILTVGAVGAIALLGYRRLTGRPLFQSVRLDAHGAVRIVDPATTRRQAEAAGAADEVRAGNDAFLRALPEADRGDGAPPR